MVKHLRHFKVRACEHASTSPLTGKKSNNNYSTAMSDHMLLCNYIVSFEDFSILTTGRANLELEIKESILISRNKPVLNKNIASLPLHLV